MKKGLFITFEGIDGCGKTTQLNMLKEMLEKDGYKVITTKEPGSGNLGSEIRKILLHAKETIANKAEMFLFLADRAQHVEMIIKPEIEKGNIVLCDRHTDSTVAYQGYGRNQDVNLLTELNDIATSTLKPDLTLLYDVSPETSSLRVGREKDRMESEGNGFMSKVRDGYSDLAKKYPERIKKIDAEKSIEEVFKETEKYIYEILKKNAEA